MFQTNVHHTLCASPPLDQGPPGPVKTNLDHVLSVTSPASPPPQWRGAPGARPCTTAAQPTRRSRTHCGIIWLLLLTSGFQDQDRVQWNTSQEHLVDNCKTAPPATAWPGAARTCRGKQRNGSKFTVKKVRESKDFFFQGKHCIISNPVFLLEKACLLWDQQFLSQRKWKQLWNTSHEVAQPGHGYQWN